MFLKKITNLKNIGRFRNASVKGGEYARLTVFYAGNGHGKTTLCALMRSLQRNDPNHVLERKTLDSADTPDVQLLLDQGPARFTNGAWSATSPDVHIFDGHFVFENVHTGTDVDTEQRRNFYRVVIGPQGVALAKDLDAIDAAAAKTQSDLTAQRKLIDQHVPKGMTLDQFLTLTDVPDIDKQLTDLQARRKAAVDATAIATRVVPTAAKLPKLPERLDNILAATLDTISVDASERVKHQIESHAMDQHGERWLAYGLAHITDDVCPFCAQSVRGSDLVTAYRGFFSDAYKDHNQAIADARSTLDAEFGEPARLKLAEAVRSMTREAEHWKAYVTLQLDLPNDVASLEAISGDLYRAVSRRLDAKKAAPLEPVAPDAAHDAALAAWNNLEKELQPALDHWTTVIVPSINGVKSVAAGADRLAIEREIARLEATKVRYSSGTATLVADHDKLAAEKSKLATERDAKKKALDAYDTKILKNYETAINRYLSMFGAGFKLVGAKKNYVGKAPQSIYGLQFGAATLDIAVKPTPGAPSFRTTMSAGDKSTLALAFFLAQLDHDTDLARKLVIFDDPFTSLDDYRREVTASTVVRVAARCAQVIVFSHDKHFLKTVKDRTHTVALDTFQISVSSNNSSIEPWDLDREVKEGYLQDHMRLQEFAQGLSTDAAAMRTLMRPLLEKYIRYRFPNQIPDGKWLGDMLAIIRSDPAHPLTAALAELEDINSYTAPFHHDPNAPFNPHEVTTFVKRTLDIVGGC